MKNRAQDSFTGRMKAAMREMGAWVSELVAPSYRPELHYMRGPGPAAARRDQRR